MRLRSGESGQLPLLDLFLSSAAACGPQGQPGRQFGDSHHMTRPRITIDGNEAAASVAHRTNEVIAIYPITPSSNMGEWADEWSAEGKKNIWGTVPTVVEMQSEGGAAGAVHGALQAGALTTTFTASQGLLLMIPNMFKIAGELTPFCIHVSARTLATHALSIFGDHSRRHGVPRRPAWRMLARRLGAGSAGPGGHRPAPPRCESRVPFLHFFDGFRTSHEVQKIEQLTDDDLRAMITDDAGRRAPRAGADARPAGPARHGAEPRRLLPGARGVQPVLRRAARASCRRRWTASRQLAGRQYHLFDYVGRPDAERVVVMMGSGAEVAHETVELLVDATARRSACSRCACTGRSRPRTSSPRCPKTVKRDRRARPHQGAGRDRRAALPGRRHGPGRAPSRKPPFAMPRSSAAATACRRRSSRRRMVKAVFDELAGGQAPRNHFTVGIVDDVTHLSLDVDHDFDIEPDDVSRGRCSSASAPTAPSAPTRTRSRSSARRPTTTPRATSSTTRRSRARSRSRTCASARSPIRSAT